MSAGTISKYLGFEFEDNGLADRARFIYRCADPYAVEFEFTDNLNVVRRWTFARELLADGLKSTVDVGDGDVLVSVDGIDVRLTLCCGTRVTLLFDLIEVIEALDETYQAVPQGGESVDFASELDKLVADHG